MSSCLSVDELRVRYGPVAAVRGVSFRVEVGEIVAIVGPNGAGKSSTLLAVSGGVQGASISGSIAIDSDDIGRLAPEHRVRRGVALVPQGRRIFGNVTVRENLVLSGLVERDRNLRQRRLEEVYDLFGMLDEFQHRPAGLLSGGQQQQLAIARALMSRPRFLLLDEPSLGLSPKIVDDMFSVLARLRGERTGVLVVEQNAARAIELASRAYLMLHGELQELPVGISADDLRARYLGGQRKVGVS
jgi:branched-chain amino acid transport system ATP-binding protein